MMLGVVCHRQDGTSAAFRVKNLSAEGLGGVCQDACHLRHGEHVHILFRNVSPIAARVAWVRGSEAGFAFERPVDISAIAAARNWNGPAFVPDEMHHVSNTCRRPGLTVR